MKINILKHYSLILLLAIPLLTNNCQAGVLSTPDEKKLETIVSEFVDLSKNPQKSFNDFTHELLEVLKRYPQLQKFCSELSNIKARNQRNARLVGITLLQYKSTLPKSLVELLIKKNGALEGILQARLNLNK